MASRTLSKLYKGSPMPMSTTLVIIRSPSGINPPSLGLVPLGQSPMRSRATKICPAISAAVRLRTSFCVPVWQNEQVSVQPTCEEMHKVPRPASGMNTVSTSGPRPSRPDACKRNSHLRVPSLDTCSVTISGRVSVKAPASVARISFDMSVMASNDVSPST